MNRRERILAVFTGYTPDRVPWFADFTWWTYAMEQCSEVPLGLYSGQATDGWQPYLKFDATPGLTDLHLIEAGVPPENVGAMYEAALELGRGPYWLPSSQIKEASHAA